MYPILLAFYYKNKLNRMISEQEMIEQELFLTEADFPIGYKHMAHTEDYIVSNEPTKSFTYYKSGRHRRLILRMRWKTSDGEYLPMSFVCDTSAPMHFYLSKIAIDKLKEIGRFSEDEDTGSFFTEVETENGRKKAILLEVPSIHDPANIMGFSMLLKLGLTLGTKTFEFVNDIEAL